MSAELKLNAILSLKQHTFHNWCFLGGLSSKRDHSKWCDDEIITRIDCKGALSLRSSKSHADHQSGVSFELITTPGTLVTMQIQGRDLLALAYAYGDLLDCFRGVKFMMLSYIFAKAKAGSTYFC